MILYAKINKKYFLKFIVYNIINVKLYLLAINIYHKNHVILN